MIAQVGQTTIVSAISRPSSPSSLSELICDVQYVTRSCETAFHLFSPLSAENNPRPSNGGSTCEFHAPRIRHRRWHARVDGDGGDAERSSHTHTTQTAASAPPHGARAAISRLPVGFWSRSQFSPLNHASSHAAPWQVVVASTVNKQNYTNARTKARDKEGCAVAKWIAPSLRCWRQLVT